MTFECFDLLVNGEIFTLQVLVSRGDVRMSGLVARHDYAFRIGQVADA